MIGLNWKVARQKMRIEREGEDMQQSARSRDSNWEQLHWRVSASAYGMSAQPAELTVTF